MICPQERESVRKGQPVNALADSRSLLVDVAKGLAIGLVALGHTNQGEITRGWWGASAFGIHLNDFIYSFHMPAFFFLSGVFLRSSVDKRGSWRFMLGKLRTVLYPYLLWSLLLPATMLVLGRFVPVRPPEFRLSLLNFVTGNGSWFLPALFLALVLGMLLRKVPSLPLLIACSLAALFWRPTHFAALDGAVAHLPFVIAGMWAGPWLGRLERLSALASLLVALTLSAGLYVAVAQITSDHGRHLGLLPAGFWGTGALLLLGRSMQGTRAGRMTADVGVASLAVFLLAPFPQGAVRSILGVAHVTQPVAQLVLPTLVAVALPAWIFRRRERLHLGWLFVWPGGITTPGVRGSHTAGEAA